VKKSLPTGGRFLRGERIWPFGGGRVPTRNESPPVPWGGGGVRLREENQRRTKKCPNIKREAKDREGEPGLTATVLKAGTGKRTLPKRGGAADGICGEG